MKQSTKTLAHLIGLGIKEARGAVPQNTVASAARLFGLDWNQAIVAGIETGKRDLSIEEMILLPSVLTAALNRTVTLADLVSDKESVRLSAEVVAHPGGLKRLLMGVGAMQADKDYVHAALEIGRKRNQARRLGLSYREFLDLEKEAADDTVIKAARQLKIQPLQIAITARKLWRRSLPEERDRRFGTPNPDESAKAVRAKRGYVTHRLLEELNQSLKGKRREP